MKRYLLLLLLCFCLMSTKAQQQQKHISEQLLNGTIKIEATNNNTGVSGTGFFFNFYKDNEKKQAIPVIITNKHVVNGFNQINLFFRKAKGNEPDYGDPLIVTITHDTNTVIQHPNKNIDLVAIPIATIYAALYSKGIDIYYIAADESRIPNDSIQKAELKSIEDVFMIGYPNGLWDSKNNLPIVRKGITATTPYLDYNGKREFMVDIAAFGGSSGSPIFFYRDIYTDKNYVPRFGTQVYLLGILYGGPMYTVEGKVIKTNPAEITKDSNVIATIPMNLGYVIKASEILEFKKILLR